MVVGSFDVNDGEQFSGSTSRGNGLLITEAIVTDQINRLADNKAAGTDGLGSLCPPFGYHPRTSCSA